MSDNDELLSWVCTALMRIGTRMATEFDHQFAQLRLTQAQFRILLAVYELGGAEGVAPSLLADHLLIERGTVSVITRGMIESGWLARQTGENRRTFRLTLTEEGVALLNQAIPRAVTLADYTLAAIPAEQLEQMRENLELVERVLRDFGPPKRKDNPEGNSSA